MKINNKFWAERKTSSGFFFYLPINISYSFPGHLTRRTRGKWWISTPVWWPRVSSWATRVPTKLSTTSCQVKTRRTARSRTALTRRRTSCSTCPSFCCTGTERSAWPFTRPAPTRTSPPCSWISCAGACRKWPGCRCTWHSPTTYPLPKETGLVKIWRWIYF